MGQCHSQFHCNSSTQPRNNDLMLKVFSFSSEREASKCYEYFQRLKTESNQFQLHIEALQKQEFPKYSNEWKIIVGIEFPERSLRSIIIDRKKSKQYFAQEEILKILELTAEFLLRHQKNLCDHIDIYAHFFKNDEGMKICCPELLYGYCHKKSCEESMTKQVILRQILELILFQKIFRINYLEILHQVQRVYSHSHLLYNLLGNLLKPEKSLNSILSEYREMKEEMKRMIISDAPSQIKENNTLDETQHEIQRVSYLTPQKVQKDSALSRTQTSKMGLYLESRRSNFLSCKQQISKSVIEEDSANQEESPTSSLPLRTNPYDQIQQKNIRYQPSSGRQEIYIQSSSQKDTQNILLIPSSYHWKSQGSCQYNEIEKLEEVEKSILLYLDTIENDQGRYEGYVKQGKKHGRGKFYYTKGMIYDGCWIDDQKNGEGSIYYSKDNLCYRGSWKDDLQHGYGFIRNNLQDKIQGYFNYRDFSTVFEQNLWKEYEGMFKEDWIDGVGTLTLQNGEKLEASWRKGMAEGRGQFTSLDGKVIKGVWSEGQLEYEYGQSSKSISSHSDT